MKLKSSVYVTKVESDYVAVATGKAAQSFSGMIQMNETAAYVVELLQKRTNEEKMIKSLREEYGIDEATARRNVEGVLGKLREADWLET